MPRAYCHEGQHFPAELLADADAELMAVADNCGEPTGEWEDGVRGLSPANAQAVREDESPVCREHLTGIEWRHSTEEVQKT